jgi:hypothetical protein
MTAPHDVDPSRKYEHIVPFKCFKEARGPSPLTGRPLASLPADATCLLPIPLCYAERTMSSRLLMLPVSSRPRPCASRF